ncbi:MAG TPA: GAF domain-containing sensor histidine kinase [Acidimicrobiales bacterium]|nr:GAF domain-containing sensor histidine kinase [Acidimicrobiales bacterium]
MSQVPGERDEGDVEGAVPTRALAAVSEALVGAATDLSLDTVLERLVHAVRDLAGARYAALGVPDGDGGFARFLTAGMSDELIESLGPLPRTHGLLDAMLGQPTPYRIADLRRDPRFRGWWPSKHPDMRSFLGYPIVFKGDVIGAFYLTDKEGAPAFDETDERLVGVFAHHAAVLVEYARLYEQSRELSVAGERSRMARELHDALTQTLFGARLAVKTATLALTSPTPGGGAVPDPAADAVTTAVEQLGRASALLEDAFGELRALILDLRPPDLAVDRLGGAVRKQLALLERTSDLTVDLHIDDDAEVAEPETERQLFRIVQEAVANVVRHATAQSLSVSISLTGSDDGGGGDRGGRVLRLEIRDDGTGFDPGERAIRSRRLGLTSMFDRAQALGGRLTIDSSPGAGTRVRAEVPVG